MACGHWQHCVGRHHTQSAHACNLLHLLVSPGYPIAVQPKQFKSYVQDPQMFWQTPVMVAVSRELVRQLLLDAGRTQDADTLVWDPTLVRYPHPEMTTLSFTGRVIAPCIFAACMFGAVTQVGAGCLGCSCNRSLNPGCVGCSQEQPQACCCPACTRQQALRVGGVDI